MLSYKLNNDVEMTEVLLGAECVGITTNRFPKEYPVYVSPAFKCTFFFLTQTC